MRHSRGFTLIELLIALVMMGVVTGGLYAMLIRTQRLTRAQTEQLSLQSTVRSASLVVPSELRELNNVVGAATPGPQVDLVAQAPTSITYRAMRGLGFVCQVTATEIRVLKDQWSAYRDPVATGCRLHLHRERSGPDQRRRLAAGEHHRRQHGQQLRRD